MSSSLYFSISRNFMADWNACRLHVTCNCRRISRSPKWQSHVYKWHIQLAYEPIAHQRHIRSLINRKYLNIRFYSDHSFCYCHWDTHMRVHITSTLKFYTICDLFAFCQRQKCVVFSICFLLIFYRMQNSSSWNIFVDFHYSHCRKINSTHCVRLWHRRWRLNYACSRAISAGDAVNGHRHT